MIKQSCTDLVAALDRPFADSAAALVSKDNLCASSTRVLDGMQDAQSLMIVLKRVTLACTVYGAASSMFVFALMLAVNFCMFGWGPVEMARANALFVIYFAGIMLPFSVLLAWHYRYKKALPYQHRSVELNLPFAEAYELSLGAALSVKGAELENTDEANGSIQCRAPRSKEAGVQELCLELEPISENKTRVVLSSQPRLSAVEHALFGYTLAVDGGKNKANLDLMISFLKQHALG